MKFTFFNFAVKIIKIATTQTGWVKMKEYITVREICRKLDKSKDWVYRHIRAGRLRALLVGFQYIIERKDYEEFKRFYESEKSKRAKKSNK